MSLLLTTYYLLLTTNYLHVGSTEWAEIVAMWKHPRHPLCPEAVVCKSIEAITAYYVLLTAYYLLLTTDY